MIQNVSATPAVNSAISKSSASDAAAQNPANIRQQTTVTKAAVPALSELNAQAFMQRQEIGAALYDRSFTLKEGARALARQDAIQAYAAQIQSKDGGPTAKDIRVLARKLNRADAQIQKLANNDRGVNLSSIEGIDGKTIDTVQANLAARINQGLKDGSLSDAEAKGLLSGQQDIADIEAKLRESDGKLTAGEQKQVLDQLRKTADQINKARNNNVGVKLGTYSYADNVDKRQAALERQLEQGVKLGSLTAEEADQVRAEFDKVNVIEKGALANGTINWRENVGLANAMNEAEIKLYDLQRNDDGVKLADKFVDVKHVDQRQAQQLESITRGIDNGRVTNEEGVALLDAQSQIQSDENKLAKGGLTRGEYLRLQTEMNNFSLLNADLQGNKARYTGIVPPAATPKPAAPAAGGGAASGTGAVNCNDASGNGGTVPPVTIVPVESKAAAPVSDEAAAPQAKPANKEPELKADAPPGVPKFQGTADDIRDMFADLMTKVMSDRTSDMRATHDRLAEKADERRRENDAGKSAGKSADTSFAASGGKDEATPFASRDADHAAKVQSYASVAEAKAAPVPVIARKVA